MSKLQVALLLSVLLVWTGITVTAQVPTGIILGTVTDESGAVIPNANVTVTSKTTGAPRALTANAEGIYSASALPPGDYEVRVEMQGFKTLIRDANVTAGNSTTVDMRMTLGTAQEVVNVEAATSAINYDSNAIAGTVARSSIQEIPLNGRSFMSLASLEPGVTVAPGTAAQFNSLISITPLGGAVNGRMLLTIDGAGINDQWEGTGTTSMNFSQEVVQEFQESTVNLDLSTGITSTGSVNIVTRSGGNDWHASGYFFYRDHNMAAYPSLKRNPIAPHPFFVRRDPGVWVSGPIIKDKLFFFANYEYMNQVQIYSIAQDLKSLAPLTGNYGSPAWYKFPTFRFDYRISAKHTLFARYSLDNNFTFGPYGGTGLPSNWSTNNNWSDQSIIGLTSTLNATMVNDLRASYHFWQNTVEVTSQSECAATTCVGLGLPSLVQNGAGTGMVGSNTFYGGISDNSPQPRQARDYELSDTFSWQKGSHRIRFGVDLERLVTKNQWQFCQLGCLGVYSPESIASGSNPGLLAQSGLVVPTSINSTASLLQLPVFNTSAQIYSGIDVGQGWFPGPYQRNQSKNNTKPQFFVGDTWKVNSSLTINAGLRWEMETGLWYTDLPYPKFLSPIEGLINVNTTAPATNPLNHFAPQIGFAYAIGKDKKTVIRGGAGMFWDTEPMWHHFREAAALGPVGDGRSTLTASSLTNIFPNIMNLSTGAPLAIGAPLPLNTLTNMTLAQFIQIYNQELPGLNAALAPTPPASGPYSVSGIDIAKAGVEIHEPNFPIMRSYQTSIGVQRDLGHGMVLQADWARRLFINVDMGEYDLNRFTRTINGVASPVIPVCTAAQVEVPGQECSTGSITFWLPEGRNVYNGLLMKFTKRMSNHFQTVVSYAWQKNMSITGGATTNGIDLDNLAAGWGPTLAPQNLNVSGVVTLPWGFQISVNNSIIARTPVEPVIPGIDLNGAGNTTFPLNLAAPNLGYNCFPDSCGKAQLTAAVAYFNATYAGHKDARGTTIPALIVPPDYQFGDPTFDTDFRLTKSFNIPKMREGTKLLIFGEVFNAFNIANLTSYGFNLDKVNANPAAQTYSFGQPQARFNQVFGSGGPRAIQIGGRINF
ncbi:MAG: carboxypeptidase-like regulatory domain-containing protein [Bryobacteraceae bacterium]|jgi:hypothetical protein